MALDPRVRALIAYAKRQLVDLDDNGKAAYLLTAAAHFATEPSTSPGYHSVFATCRDCFVGVAREQHERVAEDKRN